MIRWVERATPLSAMFSEWQRRARHAAALPPPDAPPDWRPSPPPVAATTRPLDLFYQRVSAALRDAGMSAAAPRRAWPASALRAANESLAAEIPRDLLRRELWCGAPTSAAWLRKVTAHARSVATASVLGHLLGLGDRHLDNILVDLREGDVVHVDYNIAFDRGATLPVPERVPFRLTPVIVSALGPFGVEGPFRLAAEAALAALRRRDARDVLLGGLETFARDPLMEWTEEGGAGKKHLRRADAVLEHRSLETASALTLFASRAGVKDGAGAALHELARALTESSRRHDAAVRDVGDDAVDAADAIRVARDATRRAEDAYHVRARGEDGQRRGVRTRKEFRVGVSSFGDGAEVTDHAVAAVADAALDAETRAARNRLAVERVADVAALAALAAATDFDTDVSFRAATETKTVTATNTKTGVAPPPGFGGVSGNVSAIDAEGAGVVAARNRAVANARAPPSNDTPRRSRVVSRRRTSRRIGARDGRRRFARRRTSRTASASNGPEARVAAAKSAMADARRRDQDGRVTWAAYAAARGKADRLDRVEIRASRRRGRREEKCRGGGASRRRIGGGERTFERRRDGARTRRRRRRRR